MTMTDPRQRAVFNEKTKIGHLAMMRKCIAELARYGCDVRVDEDLRGVEFELIRLELGSGPNDGDDPLGRQARTARFVEEASKYHRDGSDDDGSSSPSESGDDGHDEEVVSGDEVEYCRTTGAPQRAYVRKVVRDSRPRIYVIFVPTTGVEHEVIREQLEKLDGGESPSSEEDAESVKRAAARSGTVLLTAAQSRAADALCVQSRCTALLAIRSPAHCL